MQLSKDAAKPRQKMPTASFAWAKDANGIFYDIFMASSYLTTNVLSCNLLNASCGAP